MVNGTLIQAGLRGKGGSHTHGKHASLEGVKIDGAALLLVEELEHALVLGNLFLAQEFLFHPPVLDHTE
jgi:hypothetical protein